MSTVTRELIKQLGPSHWLLSFLQSRSSYLEGRTVTYGWIFKETGFPVGTVRRWMQRLKRLGYVEVRSRGKGMEIIVHGR